MKRKGYGGPMRAPQFNYNLTLSQQASMISSADGTARATYRKKLENVDGPADRVLACVAWGGLAGGASAEGVWLGAGKQQLRWGCMTVTPCASA